MPDPDDQQLLKVALKSSDRLVRIMTTSLRNFTSDNVEDEAVQRYVYPTDNAVGGLAAVGLSLLSGWFLAGRVERMSAPGPVVMPIPGYPPQLSIAPLTGQSGGFTSASGRGSRTASAQGVASMQDLRGPG